MAAFNNGPDAFEHAIRKTLDPYEVPYNSSDWAELEKALDGPRNVSWWTTPGMIAALVAGSLVVGGSLYLLSTREGDGRTGHIVSGLPSAPAMAPSGSNAGEERPASASTIETRAQNTGAANGTTPSGAGAAAPAALAQGATDGASSAAMHAKNVPNDGSTRNAKDATGPSPTPSGQSGTGGDAAMRPSTEMTFKASVSNACPGEEVTFVVENMPKDGIYLWNFGDGSFSNKPNPDHTFTKPGNYQVMLSMSAAGVGTIHNKPSSNIITIHEAPKADFNAVKQEFEGHIPSVHFENRSSGAKQYHWDFGDGSTSSVAHPDHVYKKKGVYPVKLTVTSERGCMDIHEKEVRIDNDYNLDAPSAFAPAQAETFMPEALRTLGVKFRLMVYTADGELVYETSDASKPWTGRMNNRGEVMPKGDYVWVVDVRESLHLSETYTGKVQLKR